jgi:hypothetical protein
MRRLMTAAGLGTLGALALVGAVAAAGPHGAGAGAGGAGTGTAAAVLGMTQAQVQELRQDGLSLAQIAQKQGVAVQKVVDALAERWNERIEVRVQNGALTDAEAATLEAQVQERARAMVEQAAPGGMRGAAVGAGPAAGQGRYGTGGGSAARGTGSGTGTCDGTGPHGPNQP